MDMESVEAPVETERERRWRSVAQQLALRVRQLEAERDGRPAPDPEDFTDAGFAARYERSKPDPLFFPWA